MPLNALLNTHYVPKTKTLLELMHARAHPHNTVHFPRWLHAKIIIPTHAGTNTCKRAHTHTHTAHFPIQCHTVTIMEMVANTFK